VNSSHIVLLAAAGLAAGTANSIAGGGSFISFPSLLVTGMLPVNANATSTVAIWPGVLASTGAYRKVIGRPLIKLVLPLIAVTLIGSLFGAWLLLHTPQLTFMKMVPWLLLAGNTLFVLGPKITVWANRGKAAAAPSRLRICLVTIAQLVVAIYIGYYGAGVGFLLLPILAMMGIENMHAMNGLRVLLATVGNAVAVVLFIAARAVIWPQALLVMVGAILGGYAGAHYAQKLKPATVRSIVISIGVGMTAYFFWRTRGM
jgi:uncharacterized protein